MLICADPQLYTKAVPLSQVYSLHRKLSGLFLLAGKLDARFDCYGIWQEIRCAWKELEGGECLL